MFEIYVQVKKIDKKKQCVQIFSDICMVLDEAFDRLTIDRYWDTWLNECQNMNNINSTNMQKRVKHQSEFTMNKTNKRFGGWSSEGMKRYDEIAGLVQSDREHNQQVEHQFKDHMMRKMYGDKPNVPKLVPDEILSDIHDKLGEKYVPYNEFSMSTTKQTDVKNIYPDSIVSSTNTGTPTKYVPKHNIKHTITPKHNIKHTITPTKHGSPDCILSQPDVIQVHQQKRRKTVPEQEKILKQNQKPITNIQEIFNSDKPKTSEIEVSHNEQCTL